MRIVFEPRLFSAFFLSLLLLSSARAAESFVPQRQSTQLDSTLKELSGLAASGLQDSAFWALNDSGNAPVLYLLDDQSRSLGWISLAGTFNLDWEDFDSFSFEGSPTLLVADTGDNAARRDFCTLHFVPEPRLAGHTGGGEVAPAWSLPFRYEDGPRDCESVAVDARNREIYLISKRTWPQWLYSLPLQRPISSAPAVARRRGIVKLPKAAPWEGAYASQSTGLAINPAGDTAAVLTYARVFLFRRNPGETWPEAFARQPERLRRHGLQQAEAVSFSADGTAIRVMSEGADSPAVIYELQGR